MNCRVGWMILASMALLGCSDDSVHSVNKEDPNNGSENNGEIVDDCSCSAEHEKCHEGTCYDQRLCANPCPENEICIDGRCNLCLENGQCFITGNEKLPPEDEGNDPGNKTECSPKCASDEVCFQGECRPKSFLWTLCRASSECGSNSNCIFELQPSTTLTYNGVTYGTAENLNIPVTILDSRINIENYKKAHPKANVSDDQRIGICSTNCTEDAKKCPSGWSCMLALAGDSVYPLDAELPFAKALDPILLSKVGFANICRPNITENTAKHYPFNKEFCGQIESTCTKAGGIFYDDMCLDKCDPEGINTCPFLFSCNTVEINGEPQGLCIPSSGTCSQCLDRDEDGAGYGLCDKPGIDCDDTDPNAFYGKILSNDEDSCKLYDEEATDLNCNGIIDRFEMVGTIENCSACGDRCRPPEGNSEDQVEVSCIPKNGGVAANDWREQAGVDFEPQEFGCLTSCSFGHGDCSQNASCDTLLLAEIAKISDDDGNTIIKLDPAYFRMGANAATVLVEDDDGDGFAALNNGDTAINGKVMLHASHTLVCCSQAPNICYKTNSTWDTTEANESFVRFTTSDDLSDIMKFDANDNDSAIKPTANDVCDGIDNDGSTVMMTSSTGSYESCRDYCDPVKHPDVDCSAIKNKNADGTFDGTYRINARCDASPDGFKHPSPFVDVLSNSYHQGDECKIYNSQKEVCNNHGRVNCKQNNGSYAFACTSNDGENKTDDTFNNIDDNCNGLIDEDAIKPCIILTQGSPESIDFTFRNGAGCTKNGSNVTCDYIVPNDNEDSYNSALAQAKATDKVELNPDGSLNLCRLGKLTIDLNNPKPTSGSDPEYYAKCMPIFQPRQYDKARANGSKNADLDFYGDGIDSNCDGYDYDLRNAVFVATAGEGNCNGSKTHTGRYSTTAQCGSNNSPGISPVASLDHAIEQAQSAVETYTYHYCFHNVCTDIPMYDYFYDDIIVQNISSSSSGQANVNPAHRLFAKKDYADVTRPGDLQTATIRIPHVTQYNTPARSSVPTEYQTPYKFHKYFIENRNLNANNYQYPEEQINPEAVVRIFGGFAHPDKNYTTWTHARTAITQAIREIDTISERVYKAIESDGSLMSLALHNMKIELLGTNATYNISQQNPNRTLLDGVTFIGLDCGYNGCEKLIMDNSTIIVRAPAGFSFTDSESPASNYHDGNGNEISKSYSSNWMNYGYHAYRVDSKNYKSTYTGFYDDNNCNDPHTCNDGSKPGYGGCGGWGYYTTPGCQKDTWLKDETCISGLSGTKAGGKGGGSGDSLDTTKSKHDDCGDDDISIDDDHNGGEGGVGKQGASGVKVADPSLKLDKNAGYLYISTDTTPGDGKNGNTGSGGGGGSAYRYYSYCPSDSDGWFHAGCGGVGGCGGSGGKAGGTGGSAIGVNLRSPVSGSNFELIYTNSLVEVTAGNGGKGQKGQAGQAGKDGGDGKAYGRVSSGSCTMYTKAGKGGKGGAGGGGGPGVGGRAGAGYSFVLSCPRQLSNNDARYFNETNANYSVAQGIQKHVCGYYTPDDFGDELNGDGTAHCSAAANANSNIYSANDAQWSNTPANPASGTENKNNGDCRYFKPLYEYPLR